MSTMRPPFSSSQKSFTKFPLRARGSAAYTRPSTPSHRGAVKISSVGMLATNSTPAADFSLPPAQTWWSGSRTVRSVPRELE